MVSDLGQLTESHPTEKRGGGSASLPSLSQVRDSGESPDHLATLVVSLSSELGALFTGQRNPKPVADTARDFGQEMSGLTQGLHEVCMRTA